MKEIKLDNFTGPLGLLLQLIENEELDITQISLAKVADQYVAHIEAMANIDPDEVADFLVVAAKLLLIKSKALLPYLYSEEEEQMEDLEAQLRMYKEFVEASKKIEAMLGKKKFMFAREFNRQSVLKSAKLFAPPKSLTRDNLKMIFLDLVGRLRPMEKLEEQKLEKKINIEEKIEHIQAVLKSRMNYSFNEILNSAETKTEIIVSFLAMLELIKQREIMVEQGNLFDEIIIFNNVIPASEPESMNSGSLPTGQAD